ncbi:hypothetical protein AAER22_03000 [Pseudomonas aeruginosa]|uniref:hypothetical protein n=1 Tax=Pseudomonas aeruginosa TaxID=287 RepID=UPI001EC64A95|nr:hypothetical protein [Pseudomonas aeruginosa]MBX6300797.1 hypothetical protein [Pseudomonas aeruginosa]MCO2109189.1 hypothetical protein [Pseudomonas aeruginosa]HBO0005058.1 hypothetical protein [Pseudomonas aeruginosa]HBO0019232.1 hypothetical protein [Pseudomonas aeruginosa]
MNAPVKPIFATAEFRPINERRSTLDVAYPKTQKKRLRFKKPQKRGGDSFTLPFVGKDHGQFSYWDVPLTTGFLVGTFLGGAIAGIYLNYIRESESIIKHILLGDIAAAWADKASSCTPSELESLRGQIKGFMGKINPCQVVSNWQGASAASAPRSDKQLLEDANSWLAMGGDDVLLTIVAAAEKGGSK